MQDLTSIIIPIRNLDYANAHYTGNCIGSIKYFTKPKYEIIIIDNASTCELSSELAPLKKVVDKYYKFDQNMGVSKAWNKGIEMSDGEYICIMNSDVEVYDYWLENMIFALDKVDMVMATPMYAYPYARAYEARDLMKDELSDFCDFSCFLAKKEIYNKVGLFDENIEIGWGEDIDFKFRLEQSGMTYKSTKMVNTHHIGMATGFSMMNHGEKVNEAMDKNREYLKNKWKLDANGIPEFKR
jgi:GT2 family glycosyltransferase